MGPELFDDLDKALAAIVAILVAIGFGLGLLTGWVLWG